MQSTIPPYKKVSKQNIKKKKSQLREDGLVSHNSEKRFPIVCLPSIVTVPMYQCYRRFTNNGGPVNGTLNISDLLNQFMTGVTMPNVLQCNIRAIRIKKIRLLAPVTSQGTSVTVSLRPIGQDASSNSFSGVPEKYLDTSASYDVPAYLALTPALTTPLGSWHYSINVNSGLCDVVAPTGTTMDILFEYVISYAEGASVYNRITVNPITLGMHYAATMLVNFVPDGVNTIV